MLAMSFADRFVFLAPQAVAPAGAIGVDSAIPGVAIDLSHWQDGDLPPGLYGDTGFELALQARMLGLLEPHKTATVVNDHIDVDGLLAAAAVLWPSSAFDTAEDRRFLQQAAACSDFTEWHGPQALGFSLSLHEWMSEARAAGGSNWEQLLYERVLSDYSAVLNLRDSWSADVSAMVELVCQRIAQHSPSLAMGWCSGLATAFWSTEHGHCTDVYGKTLWDDDMPLWVLDSMVPRAAFQYTAWTHGNGWRHLFEAPRYSWARTMVRPTITYEPPWQQLASALQERELGSATWEGDGASGIAFTGRLVSWKDGQEVVSALHPRQVIDIWRDTMAPAG